MLYVNIWVIHKSKPVVGLQLFFLFSFHCNTLNYNHIGKVHYIRLGFMLVQKKQVVIYYIVFMRVLTMVYLFYEL